MNIFEIHSGVLAYYRLLGSGQANWLIPVIFYPSTGCVLRTLPLVIAASSERWKESID
jgi:hypothetical protein